MDVFGVFTAIFPLAFELITDAPRHNPRFGGEDDMVKSLQEMKKQETLQDLAKTEVERDILFMSRTERLNESAGVLLKTGVEFGQKVRR